MPPAGTGTDGHGAMAEASPGSREHTAWDTSSHRRPPVMQWRSALLPPLADYDALY